ncbi:precorrin-3B synthase [Actibacterium sp. XHP0104]|uniref:precorrin-3B synthase n=1 Tax=Actibacterium sp. XHP0104 TaxID=2984335 RepID=UPI0021E899F2|nr:precorrin-3B synthase [Actibacterium sp. XHP0104]MCV2882717.1 precorrin-3B synthase [Actibacterium sp. XHP0104]
MSAPVIHGRCPGALRPMRSGDGLVVRVRPPLGRLSRGQARALAELAQTHGTGMIELTTRANLQIRGVADTALAGLTEALRAQGLIDDSPQIEARRNIILNPFCTGDDAAWQDAMATALIRGLAGDDLAALPGKFGFVIDAPPDRRDLARAIGDIRIETGTTGLIVRPDGADTGRAAADPAQGVEMALDLARWFIASGGVGPDGRGRMRRHLQDGATLPPGWPGDVLPAPAAPTATPGPWAGGLCITAVFGQLPAARLGWLAERAPGDMAVTPFRMLFLRGLSATDLAGADDLITRPDDPLRRVTACTGAPGCPQGLSDTRAVAATLAPRLAPHEMLHVSGCAKGCAHPGPAPLVLVARGPDLFDLIRDGTAAAPPAVTGLNAGDLPSLFDSLTKRP